MNAEPQINRFRRIPLQLAANRDLVFVAQRLSGDPIALPRTALFGGHGEPSRQPVGDAAGHEPFRVDLIVRAVFQRESRMRVRGGAIADEIDLAAGGIAAIQGALRTAQHFNAIDVEQLALSLDRQRERDAVQAHAHGRGVIGGVVDEADASQTKLRLTAAERRLHLQAGNRVLQIVDIADGLRRQALAREHRHGDTHVLCRFLAPLRGHDDFLQRPVVVRHGAHGDENGPGARSGGH